MRRDSTAARLLGAAQAAAGGGSRDRGGHGAPTLLTNYLDILGRRSPGQRDRAVAYVLTGEESQLLDEWAATNDPKLNKMLVCPGERVAPHLENLGNYRALLLSPSTLTAAQWSRLARLLNASGPSRWAKDESFPAWLDPLVWDVYDKDTTVPTGRDGSWRAWTLHLLAEIIREAGAPDGAVAPTVLAAVAASQHSWRPVWTPAAPDLYDYAAANAVAWNAAVPGLRPRERKRVIELMDLHAPLAEVFAPSLPGLVVDPSGDVRRTACAHVARHAVEVPGLLEPALASAPAAHIAEGVTLLAEVPGRAATEALHRLADAHTGAAGRVIGQALSRREALSIETPTGAVPLQLPAYDPLPTPDVGEEFVATIVAAARRMAETNPDPALRAVDADRVRSWLPFLRMETDQRPTTAHEVMPAVKSLAWDGQTRGYLPLTLAPRWLMLLGHSPLHFYLANGFYTSVSKAAVDLRAVRDHLALSGVGRPERVLAREVLSDRRPGGSVDPALVWPMFAEHPELLREWLADDDQRATSASLEVLSHFPAVPPEHAPAVARIACGAGKSNRTAAQRLLDTHPAAARLAAAALSDPQPEARLGAVEWIARRGDPAGITPLREALAAERNERAQAAILGALETLGADISAELDPATLAAQADKLLKPNPPKAIEWFPFDGLPALHWADGSRVDPRIPQAWIRLAAKLKDPLGAGLIPRYVRLLAPADQDALGRYVLTAWIGEDTRRATDEQAHAHAAAEAPRRHAQAQAASKQHPHPYWAAQAALSEQDHYDRAYAEHAGTLVGSAIGAKGVLALTAGMAGADYVEATRAYIRGHRERRAQIEALISAASLSDDPAAIQLVLATARRFGQATVQQRAAELAGLIAQRNGWTPDELADRIIPTAGMTDDGILTLPYGPRTFTARITDSHTLHLAGPDGEPVKALPRPRQSDDQDTAAASRKQLTAARKELKQTAALQTDRLHEAMCTGRAWTGGQWTEVFAGHPIMRHLATGLIWAAQPADGSGPTLFRPTADGELLDIHDQAITLPADATITLTHSALLPADTADRWRTHLADYAVKPLLDQLPTGPDDPIDPHATAVTTRQGWVSDSAALETRATRRGYQRGPAQDGGLYHSFDKTYHGPGIRVSIETSGAPAQREQWPTAVLTLTFHTRHTTIPLAEVPPVLLAQSITDYHHIADAGAYDPHWQNTVHW